MQPRYLGANLLLYHYVHRKTHMDPGVGVEKLAFSHLRYDTASKKVTAPIKWPSGLIGIRPSAVYTLENRFHIPLKTRYVAFLSYRCPTKVIQILVQGNHPLSINSEWERIGCCHPWKTNWINLSGTVLEKPLITLDCFVDDFNHISPLVPPHELYNFLAIIQRSLDSKFRPTSLCEEKLVIKSLRYMKLSCRRKDIANQSWPARATNARSSINWRPCIIT